jgi:heme/copper-type cytochrome/quinol oxidase subunit 4
VTLFGLVLLVAIVVEATIHTFLFIYLQYKRSEESTSFYVETGVVTIITVGCCVLPVNQLKQADQSSIRLVCCKD